ncbi:5274_t:CDS:2 [Diversispora eburnea]|uniref:5274_t:CDS:1 n=1 Tax=Diversispora eburnea TaxID=1213867 RepID=A0A9N9CAE8_9GLOM|nr:5274_t:CDS:2 [Diversispora eburnea]
MDRFLPKLKEINKSFGQVRQKDFGTAEDITDLPQEYKELEWRIDALHSVHTNLLRVTRVHQNSSYDYPGQIQESMVELSRSVEAQIKNVIQNPAEREAETREAERSPTIHKTLPHALARAAAQGSEALGTEEPLGASLLKFAAVQERLGGYRIKMDNEIVQKFVQPFNTTLNTNIQFAMKARKNVQSTRLTLDAARATYKNVRPERSEAARLEVEQAEDKFVAAVEEATTLMKSVNLSDLVSAQLAFYKEAYEILAELAPEIDEMQVTQEALNSRND